MKNSFEPNSQYVDISYGWKDRGESTHLRSLKRRQYWIVLVGVIATVTLGCLHWWLM